MHQNLRKWLRLVAVMVSGWVIFSHVATAPAQPATAATPNEGIICTTSANSTFTLTTQTGYIGTPSFLKIIIEKADELKTDVSSLKKAVVSGEAFFPNQKALCAERGINALQAYGTADLGLVAYETEAREGLVLEESLILEIVRPGTASP